MPSIKSKMTTMMIYIIVIAMAISAFLSVAALRSVGSRDADQLLLLMCETGQKNMDNYFKSVEQSVAMLSAYVESDLDGLDDEKLQAHLSRVVPIFDKVISKTNGVLTYYYRIDPTISQTAKGFWYVIYDEGIVSHDVTDITRYDTKDTTKLVWFTLPKAEGKPVWTKPYITENLGARVISYNTPIFYNGKFVGVIGIEIDYSLMAKLVNNMTVCENGYAFLNDSEGTIVYHPRMDITAMTEHPQVPSGLISNDKFIRYNFEGVEKQAVWLPLDNGMRLNLTVPVNEINAGWYDWSFKIILILVVLSFGFIALAKVMIERIMDSK